MQDKLIPDPLVARDRYRITLMTLWRWTQDRNLGFPQPIQIRTRNYRKASELDAFDERQRHAPRTVTKRSTEKARQVRATKRAAARGE
jgi:hypothetical protein